MDRLAAELEIDPVELRLLNAMGPGDRLPTGQVITGSLPTREVIRRAAALAVPEAEELPRDPIRLPGGAGNTTRGEGVRRGVGFARRVQEHLLLGGLRRLLRRARHAARRRQRRRPLRGGRGRAGRRRRHPPGRPHRARHRRRDARAAHDGDVGSAGSASASRMTWMAAGAVRDACRAALEERETQRRRRGRRRAGLPPSAHDAARPGDGPDHRRAGARRARRRRDAGRRRGRRRPRPDARRLDRHGAGRRQRRQPAGRRGPDRGRHGAGARPRADGGDPVTRDGRIPNASFTDYLLPTTLDMPPVEIELVEVPEPDAPYGVKGVGEPPTVVSTAAIVSAMRAATGRPLTRVPVRPDEICL